MKYRLRTHPPPCGQSVKVTHIFVEQEAFDMPYMESLKTDADYMRKLKV